MQSTLRPVRVALLGVLASFGFLIQPALAAPDAVPKTFKGTYTASGFSSATIDGKSTNRSYQGKVDIDSKGKVSGRIARTQTVIKPDGSSKESRTRVNVSGRIAKVVATTHAGFKVLIATTRITLDDDTAGTLTIYYPYTVDGAGISGGGTIKSGKLSGNMMFQKSP